MAEQPILRRLGLGPEARLLVLHADDVGLCDATVEAWRDIADRGLPLSGSIMVPAPAFAAAAALCRARPELDAGVHLTLTSEHRERWGPLTAVRPGDGLTAADGFFRPRPEALRREASRAALRRELAAQIAAARAAGVRPTHVDLHMGCLMVPELLELYLDLARQAGLPALVWRPRDWQLWDFGPDDVEPALRAIERHQRFEMPVFDRVVELPLGAAFESGERRRLFERRLAELPPGVSLLYTHPAVDGAELRALAADWPARVADHALLSDSATAAALEREDIRLVTYRELVSGDR